ncbi:MAG: acetylglutamate kinase [Verrucomicrobiota bacterium]
METQIEKASVLVEALPYLQRFRGHTFVIKVGGSAMEDEHLIDALARDLVLMEVVGVNPVIVHGGGKFISAAMEKAGLEPNFVGGFRVTDEAAISIVQETLEGEVNPWLTAKVRSHGGRAISLRGTDVFQATRLSGKDEEGKPVDLGFVGKVETVRSELVDLAIHGERVAVVSPLATDQEGSGSPLNVNADLAASALAQTLKATKLVYLSDVLGVMRDRTDPRSLIGTLTESDVESLIKEGVIQGGMIPKVRSSLEALKAGVQKVHMIDGRIPHSTLLEVFTDGGIGTEIVHGKGCST